MSAEKGDPNWTEILRQAGGPQNLSPIATAQVFLLSAMLREERKSMETSNGSNGAINSVPGVAMNRQAGERDGPDDRGGDGAMTVDTCPKAFRGKHQLPSPPLMAKQRRSKPNHTMTKTHSRIIFSLNSKGGSGNTAAMVALADFLVHNLGLNPKLVDCDLANKTFGSLSHIFKGTPKLDVRTETGLDDLLAIAKPAELEEEKAGGSRIVLADFGGGNEEDTVRWFNEMYDGLVGHDISFLGIGLLTSNVATAKGIISWSAELRDRINYLIIRNHMAGSNFSYLFETEIGRKFFNASNAPVIDMEKRAQNIQNELVNRGLSLRQAIDAPPDVAGPVLGTFAARVRMRGYVARLEEQFATVKATLVPDLSVPV